MRATAVTGAQRPFTLVHAAFPSVPACGQLRRPRSRHQSQEHGLDGNAPPKSRPPYRRWSSDRARCLRAIGLLPPDSVGGRSAHGCDQTWLDISLCHIPGRALLIGALQRLADAGSRLERYSQSMSDGIEYYYLQETFDERAHRTSGVGLRLEPTPIASQHLEGELR